MYSFPNQRIINSHLQSLILNYMADYRTVELIVSFIEQLFYYKNACSNYICLTNKRRFPVA